MGILTMAKNVRSSGGDELAAKGIDNGEFFSWTACFEQGGARWNAAMHCEGGRSGSGFLLLGGGARRWAASCGEWSSHSDGLEG
jgi:hypothetical protein